MLEAYYFLDAAVHGILKMLRAIWLIKAKLQYKTLPISNEHQKPEERTAINENNKFAVYLHIEGDNNNLELLRKCCYHFAVIINFYNDIEKVPLLAFNCHNIREVLLLSFYHH